MIGLDQQADPFATDRQYAQDAPNAGAVSLVPTPTDAVKLPTADQTPPKATTGGNLVPGAPPIPSTGGGAGNVVPGTPDIPSSGAGHFDVNPATGQPWPTPPPPPPPPTGGSTGVQTQYGLLSAADKAQIDAMLSGAQSTDDPNYWYSLAAQHGGVASTGVDWLTGRINQGDGALGVRNGTVKKFQDTPSGGTNTGLTPPIDPSQYAGSTFTDPATSYYENLLKQYSAQLLTPQTNPAQQQLYDLISKQIQAEQSAIGPFEDAATARMKQLQGPLYTNPQWDAVQTQTFDALEHQRQQAIQSTTEQLAALGHGSTSGTLASALQQVNAHYDQLRAQAQNQLQVQTFQQEQTRQDQAVQLAQALSDAVMGRQSQVLNLTGSQADITAQQQAQDLAREGQAVATGATLADLPAQRLQLAEQAFGIGNGPSNSLSSSAISLLNSVNAQQNAQVLQRQQFASGLGQYLGYILSGNFGKTPTSGSGTTIPNVGGFE